MISWTFKLLPVVLCSPLYSLSISQIQFSGIMMVNEDPGKYTKMSDSKTLRFAQNRFLDTGRKPFYYYHISYGTLLVFYFHRTVHTSILRACQCYKYTSTSRKLRSCTVTKIVQ